MVPVLLTLAFSPELGFTVRADTDVQPLEGSVAVRVYAPGAQAVAVAELTPAHTLGPLHTRVAVPGLTVEVTCTVGGEQGIVGLGPMVIFGETVFAAIFTVAGGADVQPFTVLVTASE